MAILDLLKRTKKRIDDTIPDFNLTQKAGTALRQANQIRQNLPIAQEGRRLTDMLSAQRDRQAEQARLRREREIQAKERRMEESRRRMDEMKAKEQERNRQREENQRKLRERTSAVGRFVADIPKGLASGALTTGANAKRAVNKAAPVVVNKINQTPILGDISRPLEQWTKDVSNIQKTQGTLPAAKKVGKDVSKLLFEIPTIQNVYQRGLDAKLAKQSFDESAKINQLAYNKLIELEKEFSNILSCDLSSAHDNINDVLDELANLVITDEVKIA
jgi:hypothetical protein